MLTIIFLSGSLFVFGFGYYLGHQIGGTAHIRSKLNNSNSEQLISHH
jgi:hypothetical protein